MISNELSLNRIEPRVMHIDLNSCFAIIEQQANRLLRGRPVGVAAYDTPRGFVVAASYEAKRKGVKLGVNVGEAKQMCPGIVIVTPDPAKYREAHKRFKELLLEFTNDVTAKSIDEFVLHMDGSPEVRNGKTMEQIGEQIKQRVRESLGEWVTVNIGIGPNRFLAKYAAGFNKPDGMTRIDHNNLREMYDGMNLIDLPGINIRFRRRLRMYGVHTPLQFLDADRYLLEKVVFKSIGGFYWYLRLRGHEIDRSPTNRGSIGHQYALPNKTADRTELARLLMKLCEKVGRRLRRDNLTASGIHLYLDFVRPRDELSQDNGPPAGGLVTDYGNGFIGGDNMQSGKSWHKGQKLSHQLYSTESIYRVAKSLLAQAAILREVRGMSITVYKLAPADPEQLNIFESERGLRAQRRVSDAVDEINNRYGEFVITPGTMMEMSGEILDRIAFGSVRDL